MAIRGLTPHAGFHVRDRLWHALSDHLATLARHHHVVLDANTDTPPLARHAFLAAVDTIHRDPGYGSDLDAAYADAFFGLLGDDLLEIPASEAAERLRRAQLDPSEWNESP